MARVTPLWRRRAGAGCTQVWARSGRSSGVRYWRAPVRAGERYVSFNGLAKACAKAGGFPEPEIINYNAKEFDFGKDKPFPLRDQHFFTSVDKVRDRRGRRRGWQEGGEAGRGRGGGAGGHDQHFVTSVDKVRDRRGRRWFPEGGRGVGRRGARDTSSRPARPRPRSPLAPTAPPTHAPELFALPVRQAALHTRQASAHTAPGPGHRVPPRRAPPPRRPSPTSTGSPSSRCWTACATRTRRTLAAARSARRPTLRPTTWCWRSWGGARTPPRARGGDSAHGARAAAAAPSSAPTPAAFLINPLCVVMSVFLPGLG